MNHQLVATERLTKMTGALAHRGPDGEQCWKNASGTTGLAHRRLAIIDLSDNAVQPMHYLGRYTIVYNGEIYNYIELKKELAAGGYVFASLSDTEVILAAYDCWKENCLQHFDGMFAFAVWDEKEQTLFAARDRLGEKPFFYWFNGQQLLFASEMKAIWAAGVDKNINEHLLFNFITLGYTQNPRNPSETAYRQINKLPAASYFSYLPAKQTVIAPVVYWKPGANATNIAIHADEAVEQFYQLFRQSIEKRLRSDVPLGTSLSGGLDSSSIAVMIQQLQAPNFPLQTFSAVFPGSATDESQYISLLTAEKNIVNFTVQPTADDFINDFEKLCYFHEGFITSASVFAQFKVFELAKQHNITVLLDGQGADEMLAGYHKYYHWYWQELYSNNRSLLTNEITAARQLGIQESWSWKNKLSASFPVLAGSYISNARKKKQLSNTVVSREFADAYGTSYYQLPPQDSLQQVLYYNTFVNGMEELLQYADRNSMAHGREVRLPFLQHQLVEFVFSLPARFKIKDGRTKWLLRQAMNNLLPAAIAWRTDKIGFEPPQKEWMQHPVMQEYIREARKKMVAAGIANQHCVDKELQPMDTHAAGNTDWRLLVAARLL